MKIKEQYLNDCEDLSKIAFEKVIEAFDEKSDRLKEVYGKNGKRVKHFHEVCIEQLENNAKYADNKEDMECYKKQAQNLRDYVNMVIIRYGINKNLKYEDTIKENKGYIKPETDLEDIPF